ncbi:MAG: SDR family NAD(P)-dependent oxidoreductase [Dehalococcoidales bacterium]
MSLPNFSLEGKVAIVTGGSKGIGREIALVFAEAGADVVVSSRGLDSSLEDVAEEIRKLGRRSLAIPADIRKKSDVDQMVQRTVDEFNVIDILVNNAGILLVAPFVEHSEEDWDRIMDTNLKGYYLCSQAVVKKMMAQKKGNIINMASIRSIGASRGRVGYCVSKAGVVMLTRVMALEFASYNIRVNSIAPGWIMTKLNEHLWGDPNTRKQIEAEIPLGYLAEPSVIATAALFLASDASSYITGHTIVVDGGLLA